MSTADRICEFLMRRGGQGFCDDCLRKALRLRNLRPVQQATEALGKSSAYSRETRFCGTCGNERLTLRAFSARRHPGSTASILGLRRGSSLLSMAGSVPAIVIPLNAKQAPHTEERLPRR